MNDLIKQYKEREAIREERSKKFFRKAKSKLPADIRDFLLKSDKFEWSTSESFGYPIVTIIADYLQATFDGIQNIWIYYVIDDTSVKNVSEQEFLKHLKLSAFF